MSIYTTVDSPLGELLLVGEPAGTGSGVALASVSFGRPDPVRPAAWRYERAAFAAVERQLREYFAGTRTGFEVDVVPRGTPFQRRVWAAVDAIPYGRTVSYGALAERIGAARDRVRAVAAAVGANPLLIVRPCHRVLGADGSLTGYAGGVDRKERLLVVEGARQPQLI